MRNLFKINKQKVIELFKFKKYPKKKNVASDGTGRTFAPVIVHSITIPSLKPIK
jgi:hypothetical protein